MNIVRDISYSEGDDSKHHCLDIYQPREPDKIFPVIIFVHGGGWRISDKNGIVHVHQNLCTRLAEQGFVTVAPNYRLSPEIMHPGHAEDITDALKWISIHIGEYGGDVSRLYLMGHSAGAHICAFIFTHPTILEKKGIGPGNIKALIGISGIYDIPEFARWKLARRAMIRPAFGDDPELWKQASPYYSDEIIHSPMLLLNAQLDKGLEKQSMAMLEKFRNPLNRFMIVPGTSHFLVIAKFSPPVNIIEEIVKFIREST